jgi:hypothetical protein
MKEQDKQAPTVVNNFHAPIGQYVQYQHIENMTIGSDGQIHVASSSQPAPQPESTAQQSAAIDPTPLIFLPNEQNPAAIEELLKSTLTISTKKSVICRKLYEQRALYNLHAQDDSTKAAIINAWIDKFGITIKTPFTRHDFGENYCK